MNNLNLAGFTDILGDEIDNSQESQPLSLSSEHSQTNNHAYENLNTVPLTNKTVHSARTRPAKGTGQHGQFRSVEEIEEKYRSVFSYPYFNLVQSNVIEDALYSDKSMVVCAPTGSGKTVVFEMAIVQLLMEIEDTHYTDDFKIIYMAPVKAICTERLTEWYPKFTRLGLLCIVITGDTDVDFSQLQPYRIIITTPEKWDMVTRRWREHRQLVEVIKLFLIDEVHILNDETRGPVLEAVVSRMKTIESSAQSAHRIEQLQNQYQGTETTFKESAPKIRFVAVSATVSNPQDVAAWLGTEKNPAVFYKFGDESRPVKLKRTVEGYPCPEGSSIFKFDIVLNYRLWSVIQKYHNGKPTLIFCNTRKSVMLTAETLSRELTVAFNPEQKAKLAALASTIKNKKLQALILSGVGCHHAGLLFEERTNIEHAFRNRDLPILITTTTLAMGVNLPAHLVIIKNTQQYVNGAYQEYSISTILQMVGRAGRPQYDTEATAVIMTRLCDKPRYEALVGGSEPLQSYLHKRLAENLNSEVALGTVNDVAQCVQWLRSTFLSVRAARDPKRYLGLPQAAPQQLITKKIEELCVKAMNGLATSGLITMDDASCIESTEAGRLMSVFYLDLETMKHIMKINGTETLERLLWIICESHELADMHLRVDERRCLNTLNRNNATATIRFPMKGKISSRQMKLNCIIQAILGCLNIPDPSLNQEAMKIMRIADRVCKCLVAYVTRPALVSQQPKHYSAVLNSLILAKCMAAHLWENSLFVSKQLRGIGPTFSTLLATAGKVNFMLLEESHPRDLERIMNKGPPAGNVLRKQVSLLPKYQLTMTPIDEKTVLIQLVLLNQNYLSENMENLTAGASHKSYLVVGDSENNLLLYNCFKDTDLISIYDGTITYQITRKYSYEHKVFANCISASFVGIDAQSEYLFKDIEPVLPAPYLSPNIDLSRRQANKQTVITDTFKERKRRNNSGNDITLSKEKKKRDGALLEKFKYLKESFGKSSKKLKEELNKSTVTSNKILEELTNLEKPKTNTVDLTERVNDNKTLVNNNIDKSSIQPVNTEEIDSDDFVDDEKINCILNEIENEISEENLDSNFPCVDLGAPKTTQKVQRSTLAKYFPIPLKEQQRNNSTDRQGTPSYNSRKRTPKNNKLNYNFIGLLEKENSLSDEEEKIVSDKTSGFSSTIKNQIEKYLQQTKIMSKEPDRSITELLKNDNSKVDRNNVVTEENTDFDVQRLTPTHTPARNFLRNLNVDFIQSQEKDLEQSSTTNNKKDEDIVKLAIDDEIRDINHIDAEGISYNKKPDEFNSHCAVELNTSLNYPIHSTNVTDKTDYLHDTNPKEKCLIPYNNYYSLIPHNTHRDAMNENTKINSSFRSIKDKATSIIALPHKPFQVLTRPENPLVQKQITCIENDMINSGSDLLINPDFRGPTCALNSNLNQFKASAEYNYDDYVNSSNHNVSVRKYAYSSTNIDISTRDDHLVVKKIKMDWNITEIISQEKKVSSSYWDIFPDDKTFNAENNTIELEPSQPYPLNSTSENNAKKKGEEIKKPAISYDRKKLKKDNTKNIQDSFTEKNDRPKITSPLSQCSLMCVQIEQMPSDSNTRVHDLRDNIANEEPIQMNLSPQKENKCIENILQKYSKIFKKNNAENLSQNLTQTKVVDRDLPNTPSEKPKRPFKITDIQNFNTPLPKTLISETFKRENVVKSIKSIPNIEDVPSKIQKDIKRNNEIEYVLQITPIQENFQKSPEIKESWIDFNKKCAISVKGVDSDNSGGELLKYESPIKDSEPQQTESMDIIDYNLDHSMMMMMNPKTLLQSLTKDEPELIVPPPSEFCDERDLNIPILDDNDDLTVPMDCYEPWDISCDETKEYIYQDDIDFMPRNEIETWALSQNSESYENFAASTSINKPGQSFTIMREPRQQISPFQNISVTRKRQNRLGQFKFCRKSKLPPKL